MTKQLIIRAAATTALALSLTGAMASADIGSMGGQTGPDSNNNVSSHFSNSQSVDNDNNLGVANQNGQQAYSGEANATHNTTAGGAASGQVSNNNNLNVGASVSNTASAAALGEFSAPSTTGMNIGTTGPDSNNSISSTVSNEVRVNNNNNVNVSNNSNQSATSGDASVRDNTTGGSAMTGAVSNVNSSTVALNVTN